MNRSQHLVPALALLIVMRLVGNAAANDLPALKDVFQDAFLIGGALNRNLVAGKDPNAAAIAINHYNSATSENDMKWSSIHPQLNEYNWEAADSFMAFCAEHKLVPIGHTLIWHSQVPRTVFRDEAGNDLTRAALLARMEEHIKAVVGRYKGRIKGWDVVNEALEDDGSLKNSRWLRIIGEGDETKQYDYLEHAFRYAHAADPEAELYYNDYSLSTSRAKCNAAVAIVKHLQSKGVRIDGVGMQLHAGLSYPRVEDLEYAITTLAESGVQVLITEMDMRTGRGYRGADIGRVNRQSTDDPAAQDAETQKKIADKYAEIFQTLHKHKDKISRVTLWGVYDGTSWIGGSPLLFDHNYQPKEAFFAVVKVGRDHQ